MSAQTKKLVFFGVCAVAVFLAYQNYALKGELDALVNPTPG